MRAGLLKHPIIIQEVTETNSAGKVSEEWTQYTTARAEMLPQQGSEYWAAKQTMEKEPVLFKTRYQSGITQKMRLLHDYIAYDIHAVPNVKGLSKELLIVTSIAPKEYPNFGYFGSNVADGDAAYYFVITWTTDFYASSKAAYRIQGAPSWTTTSHTDADPRVLSHSKTIGPLEASKTYEYRVYGVNEDLWTPGWSSSGTFETDVEGKRGAHDPAVE